MTSIYLKNKEETSLYLKNKNNDDIFFLKKRKYIWFNYIIYKTLFDNKNF